MVSYPHPGLVLLSLSSHSILVRCGQLIFAFFKEMGAWGQSRCARCYLLSDHMNVPWYWLSGVGDNIRSWGYFAKAGKT